MDTNNTGNGTTTARRPTNWVEWVISGIFLLVVLKYSYTTFTVVGLLITMIVLFAGAVNNSSYREEIKTNFLKMFGDNNWVFYTMLWLFLSSLVFWILGLQSSGPLPEMNPVRALWGALKDAAVPPPADPYANDGFSLTRFLLGDKGGWGKATLTYLLWALLARPVSFWDDWVERAKRNKGKDGGFFSWLVKMFVHEGVGELLWSPFKKK